jgi:signal transduction histidine kinase/CheY-like chemotaxis protein
MITDKLVNLFDKLLFYRDENLPLGRKIHILITFLAVLLLLFETGVNIFLGMNFWIILFTLVYVLIGIVFYFLSINDKYHQKSVLPLFFFSVLLFSVVWIFNAGYDGSNIGLLFLLFLVLYAIVKPKHGLAVFLSFLTVFSILAITQYYFPHLFFGYKNKEQRFIDMFIGNFFYFIFTYLIVNLIIKNYIAENKKVVSINTELILRNNEIAESLLKLREADAELRIAKEKAEESDRLKTAFLANMSHEIRTPMNGIIGFADLLKEQNLTDSEQKEYVNLIKKSGIRMLNIINDLIDISKIEAGQTEIVFSACNVNEQIEFIYYFFKPEAENKGLQLIFHNGLPEKEALINTDREKIYAILTNLIKNAIKYSDNGTIEFGYFLGVVEPIELTFYIKDMGIGIPKEKQKYIFDRFVQVDFADKKARQGTGLGLSITKSYVEMLGGKIWLESEVGKGSTFYFTIPYNLEQVPVDSIQNISTQYAEKHPVKNLKILIADDDEISEILLAEVIKNYSTDVLFVKTGLEAIVACRMHPDIDMVLMDIQMPDMDGYEATREIRKFNKNVFIIAQTAYVLTGDREKAIAAGCDDYVSKPINKMKIIELIQKL